jgi:fido (protein-threonine AMPylation protein)
MYEVHDDTYCYPGTTILKNLLDLKERVELDAFEAEITNQRALEPLPDGLLDSSHYKAIHRHLFQDVYSWAGTARTMRLSKGGSAFCFPEYIDREMTKLFAELAQKKPSRQFRRGIIRKGSRAFLGGDQRDTSVPRRQRPRSALLPDIVGATSRTSARPRSARPRTNPRRNNCEL